MRKLLILVSILIVSNTYAQDDKWGKISGLMFGDYYHMTANHESTRVGANGFWFRRIYLTYENDINEKFSMRLRMEMASGGKFEGESSLLVPFVKDAYLKWKINKNHQMLIGISEPPTFRVIEEVWGHRYLEKTPLDLYKWAPSRDFGISMRGNVISSGKIKYHVMLANGNGNKDEMDKGKKVMASMSFHPSDEWIFEVYGDWNDNTGHKDWLTLQAFAGYRSEKHSAGLQFAHQERQAENAPNYDMNLISAFWTSQFTDVLGMALRVDRMMDPNPSGEKISYLPMSDQASSTLFIAGLSIKPVKNLTITPNVEFVKYDKTEAGITPDSDVMPRLTFYFKF